MAIKVLDNPHSSLCRLILYYYHHAEYMLITADFVVVVHYRLILLLIFPAINYPITCHYYTVTDKDIGRDL